jgi:hypothetical protein
MGETAGKEKKCFYKQIKHEKTQQTGKLKIMKKIESWKM